MLIFIFSRSLCHFFLPIVIFVHIPGTYVRRVVKRDLKKAYRLIGYIGYRYSYYTLCSTQHRCRVKKSKRILGVWLTIQLTILVGKIKTRQATCTNCLNRERRFVFVHRPNIYGYVYAYSRTQWGYGRNIFLQSAIWNACSESNVRVNSQSKVPLVAPQVFCWEDRRNLACATSTTLLSSLPLTGNC